MWAAVLQVRFAEVLVTLLAIKDTNTNGQTVLLWIAVGCDGSFVEILLLQEGVNSSTADKEHS